MWGDEKSDLIDIISTHLNEATLLDRLYEYMSLGELEEFVEFLEEEGDILHEELVGILYDEEDEYDDEKD